MNTAESQGKTLSQRELGYESGRVLRAVSEGRSFVLTNSGVAVGRIIPLDAPAPQLRIARPARRKGGWRRSASSARQPGTASPTSSTTCSTTARDRCSGRLRRHLRSRCAAHRTGREPGIGRLARPDVGRTGLQRSARDRAAPTRGPRRFRAVRRHPDHRGCLAGPRPGCLPKCWVRTCAPWMRCSWRSLCDSTPPQSSPTTAGSTKQRAPWVWRSERPAARSESAGRTPSYEAGCRAGLHLWRGAVLKHA